MKKFRLLSTLLLAASATLNAQTQQEFTGADAAKICPGSSYVVINRQSRVPSFVRFADDAKYSGIEIFSVLKPVLQLRSEDTWQQYRTDRDALGFTHNRYQQYLNGVKVKGGEYLVHERNGRVESVNGMFFDNLNVSTTPVIDAGLALSRALTHIGAQRYKWEMPEEEALLKQLNKNANATYYPMGELMVTAARGDIYTRDMRLVWAFDVYADAPLSRRYIYVDATTGEIVHEIDRICHADVNATANTRYSGNQPIVCDQVSANSYRLREAGRGQGVITLDMNNGTNYGSATDFTSTTTTWTSTVDNVAYDAHWGAEETYDYYTSQHNRNGIDNNGFAMYSYVHYGNNYNNAFWDGQRMTYGDGSQSPGGFNPLTSLDVCGHEFTHGVTEYSANLDYSYESGALNESFSDIFGTAIEFYAKPNTANFLMGEEISVPAGTPLRSMSNPNQYGDPDCYNGTNYYTGSADNGGVHTNSGVQNFWYYLLCQGGTGTNDLNNAYNVTGQGITKASAIAYRNLSVYLINTSQYADARTYAIQSAQDLYGACTPEVTATANAWYACGVGGPYSPVALAGFSADVTTTCSVPAQVNFTNTSSNISNAVWNFGDNNTSTQYSPTHTYTQPGTYTVQLIGSGACGTDTILQTNYINVNPPAAPATTPDSRCDPGTVTLSATGPGTLYWFAQPTGGTSLAQGNTFTTPVISTTTNYYVQAQTAQAPGNAGPANNNFGTGGQHNNTSTQYLEFTVYQPCTLSTAVVNAGAAGNRTFILWDNTGNQLQQITVAVPASGVQTVNVNLPLTPGSYRIGGTQMNLYRNNAGASYPYTLNNVLSITGSSAGSAFYYYLYNWTLTLPDCIGPRVPVTATIGNPAVQLSTAAYDTTCLALSAFALSGGQPAGGTYSGPGVTNNTFDPMAAGIGTHTITYTYVDQNNCTTSVTSNVLVEVCTGLASSTAGELVVNVMPNPFSSDPMLIISGAENGNETVITITDVAGRIVFTQRIVASTEQRIQIPAASWSQGLYMIQVQNGNNRHIQRIIKQN
jgi:Zn-dependent metalloprotease